MQEETHLLENKINNLAKTRYGYTLYNKNDKYIGKSIQKYGEFSHLEALLFKQICKTGDVVVEVGSNIGTHTIILAGLVGNGGKIFAFEPQRIIFQNLCANIAINSLMNVFCYQLAVGAENGFANILDLDYEKEENFGGISLNNANKGSTVQKITLDSFLNEEKIKLLKVDVEGMEREVLEGARKTIEKTKPFLYVENDRREKSKELIEYIWSLGYVCFWHTPRLFNPDNFYKQKENIFGNIVSVNMLCIHKEKLTMKLEGFLLVEDSNKHILDKN